MAEQIDPNALPDDLTVLDADQLDAAEQAARDEAATIQEAGDDMTDEQVERLVALADFVEAVETRRTEISQAAEQRAQRAEDAARRLAPVEDSEDTPEADPAVPGEGDDLHEGVDEAEGDDDAGEEGDDSPEAVAAGGTRRRTPMRQPRNPVPARQGGQVTTIVAAADIPGFTSGQQLDLDQVAAAFTERAKAFPQGVASQRNQYSKLLVASVRRDFTRTPDGLSQDNRDFSDDYQLAHAAASERRLSGGSLIAARAKLGLAASGGWCAPSETNYDLQADETTQGMLDVPTMGITRGGLNFTPGPDFADIYTDAGFSQTEAQAIAGDTKNCVEIDCPDFDEVRLDAVGICVKAPLLTNAAYPELVRRWISGTEVANEHKVNVRVLSAISTALGSAVVPTLTGTPFAWGLLSAVELAIIGQRQARRLSLTDTMEVVLPLWSIGALRADFANRMGIGADSVTDAQIRQHFADRGASVQFVWGMQELSAEKPVAYPATVTFFVYAAGTFVKGTASVVNLSTVYDTADLVTNVYTAAFVEDGVLVAKLKNGGAKYTVPVNPTGMLGAASLNDNIFSAQS